VTGLERERLLEARKRIGVALERVQHEPQVGARIGRARVDRERRADQPIGLACLPGLMLKQSQQMQRIEMVAPGFENARVDFFRLRKIAPVMEGDGLFERLREVRCDGLRHGQTHGRGAPPWLEVNH